MSGYLPRILFISGSKASSLLALFSLFVRTSWPSFLRLSWALKILLTAFLEVPK